MMLLAGDIFSSFLNRSMDYTGSTYIYRQGSIKERECFLSCLTVAVSATVGLSLERLKEVSLFYQPVLLIL